MKKNMLVKIMLLMQILACLLLSGCFIVGGKHFLWF